MTNTIDWSKAPEDATHAAVSDLDNLTVAGYYKDITRDSYMFTTNDGLGWGEGFGRPMYYHLIPRPLNKSVVDIGKLSKREYFAGLAMQGLLASDHEANIHQNDCVKIAVAHADALLKALEE